MTKILPNVRVNFLVRFASEPLFCWIMTSDPLELFRNSLLLFARIFGFVGPFFRPVMFLVRMVFFAILRLFPKNSLKRLLGPRCHKQGKQCWIGNQAHRSATWCSFSWDWRRAQALRPAHTLGGGEDSVNLSFWGGFLRVYSIWGSQNNQRLGKKDSTKSFIVTPFSAPPHAS